jgi:Fe-S-cluster containining protein
MTTPLPLAHESPCFGCFTPCCYSYVVPVTALDVWRLQRSFAAPWQKLVEVQSGSIDYWDSFRLDESALRWSLRLQHRPAGQACRLLVEVPGGHARCGAHEGRPLACRAYPYKITDAGDIAFISHAMCPPPQRRAYELAMGAMKASVENELLDLELHVQALQRWDALALTVPRAQAFVVDDYVRWMLALWDAVALLRVGARAEWEPVVVRAIDAFPLPSVAGAGC